MLNEMKPLLATMLLALPFLGGCNNPGAAGDAAAPAIFLPANAQWRTLDTVAFRGKQDDIYFVTPKLGWYGNGSGKIYRTTDGGASWTEQLSKPGTFVRALGFIDERTGFAGNIGTDYFPGVTDTTPLYRTDDGGVTWNPVTNIEGPTVKGLCAIDVLQTKFIDSGVMRTRTVIHAGGRVGGPAFLLRSLDGGATWKSQDLSAHTKMILDVKFFDESQGFVMGASDTDVQQSNALIIATRDGGATWKEVYRSSRPFELTWKVSFPTRNVGYATIQSYNPDEAVKERYVAKTTDGGATWREISLVSDAAVREFGVGFASPEIGWIGTSNGGYQTIDGGKQWKYVDMGRAVNKIRIVRDTASTAGFVAYAIGADVRKLEIPN